MLLHIRIRAFRDFLTRNINLTAVEESPITGTLIQSLRPDALPSSANYYIYRDAHMIEDTGDLYATEALSVTNNPTATNIEFAAQAIPKKSVLYGNNWDPSNLPDVMLMIPDGNEFIPWLEYYTQSQAAVSLGISSVGEVADQTWLTEDQYPAQVIMAHMAIDTYSVSHPTSISGGILGGDLDNYHIGETPIWQNPDKCQIYLTKTAGGNFDAPFGIATIKFDMSMHHLGYHEVESSHTMSILWPYATGIYDWTGYHLNIPQPVADSYTTGYLHYTNVVQDEWLGEMAPSTTAQTGIMMHIPTTMLPQITSVNEDETINGSGDALSITSNYAAHDYSQALVPSDGDIEEMTWTIPGVVFRVSSGAMYITVLGDQVGTLSATLSVVISGCDTHTENNFGGNAVVVYDSWVVEPFTEIISGTHFWTSSDWPAFQSAPAENWGSAAKYTVVKFLKSEQSDTVQGLWDSAYSYGEHNTVRFTYGDISMSLINGGALLGGNGLPTTGSTWMLHPRRNGITHTQVEYFLAIKGTNGEVYDNMGFFTNIGWTDKELGVRVNEQLSNLKTSHPDAFKANVFLKSTYATHNISGNGLVVKVNGDLTSFVKVGDVFNLAQDSSGGAYLDQDRLYRVKFVGAYSDPYTTLTIASAATDPYGGADGISAVHPVQTSDQAIAESGYADGDYANCLASFYSVKVTTDKPDLIVNDLEISAWSTVSLTVNEFKNGYVDTFANKLDVRTRDIDFGVPASIKAFYKIIFTYKCLTHFHVQVAYDGSGIFELLDIVHDSSSWMMREIYLNGQHLPVKAQSIQLRFKQVEESFVVGFELNDITLVYRSL